MQLGILKTLHLTLLCSNAVFRHFYLFIERINSLKNLQRDVVLFTFHLSKNFKIIHKFKTNVYKNQVVVYSII